MSRRSSLAGSSSTVRALSRALLPGLIVVGSLASGAAARGEPAEGDQGAVFALTNAPAGNAVVAYRRAADGSLTPAGTYASGGAGTGAGLFSQHSVIVTDDKRFLLAVNAGSNSISSFRIRQDGLQLIDTIPSGGIMPTRIAARGGLLFVLNAGVPNNVTGFRLNPQGSLSAIAGSTAPLSAASTNPAQVAFSQDGGTLIVSERATNILSTFVIGAEAELEGPFINASAGPTPFGFAVGLQNTLFVSEAGAGGGASTYRVREGDLAPVSSMIMTGQRAACWAILTPNGRFGYVTNAGTGNISGFAIGRDSSGALLQEDGVTATTGGNPTDMAMSNDGRFLYARVAARSEIAIYRIESTGALTPLPALTGTPGGLVGLGGF